MPITIDFSGKTALVTGASQGIGAEIARIFHEAGADVFLNHPDLGTTRADAEGLADELNQKRRQSAWAIAADVSKPDAVQSMMAEIKNRAGGLDFLINNAGIIRDRTVAKMSLDEWRAVIEVNLSGVFYCCKLGLEILKDGGAITNLGSLSADMGFHGQGNYSATKAGVQALTRVLSKEVAKRSIRVNAVAPGAIDTAMMATVAESVRHEMLKMIPLGRMGSPREVAQVILFLCSPLASYITGQTVAINGGWKG